MRRPTPTMEGNLRAVRIIHIILLYCMFFYIGFAEWMPPHTPHDVRLIWTAFLLICLALIAVTFNIRSRKLQTAVDVLQTQPDDPEALTRWRLANILSSVIAESIVLLGFALRFLGGSRIQSAPFYVVAIALMLIWWPRRP